MIHSTQVHNQDLMAQEYLTGWQRARADLINLQQRLAREQTAAQNRAREEVIYSLLSLADNFQAMVSHLPEELSGHPWAQGVVQVSRQFDSLLQEHGVLRISASGLKFDPELHEAVAQVEKRGVASGLIVEVIQPGYQMGDKVIRPAKVKIAK